MKDAVQAGSCQTAAMAGGRLSVRQDLELRLSDSRGQLSSNDERIAVFLRDHLDELPFVTADSLAQGAGVSTAAVVRFARRLGFTSFRELRDLARTELRAGQPKAADGSAQDSVLARKVRRDVASLELLPHMVEHCVTDAAAAIEGAASTWVLAGRETQGLAVYAQRLLHHTRRTVRLLDPAFPDDLRDADERTVVLAISFRPYARLTLQLLDYARAAGSRIVLLTDGLAHSFIAPDDVVLAVPVDSPTFFLSFTPAVCVLESLAAAVSGLDPDKTYETLEATAKLINAQNLTLEGGKPGEAGSDCD